MLKASALFVWWHKRIGRREDNADFKMLNLCVLHFLDRTFAPVFGVVGPCRVRDEKGTR